MVGAFFGYLISSAILTNLAGWLLPFVDLEQKQDLGIEIPQNSLELTVIFLLLVVFVPLLEELIFRGFMFKALRARLSFWPTAILVSIVFGASHGQWNVGIDTFALSMFLCGLREYTGSLWASVLLHATKNALAFSVLFLFPDILTRLQ
jgi:membrane protease YdiL (CAAX protease family)